MDYVDQFSEWVGEQIRAHGVPRSLSVMYATWHGLAFPEQFKDLEVGKGYVWEPGPMKSDPRKPESIQSLKLRVARHNRITGQAVRVERVGKHWLVTRRQ